MAIGSSCLLAMREGSVSGGVRRGWTAGRVLRWVFGVLLALVVAMQLFFAACIAAMKVINPPVTAFMIQQWWDLSFQTPEVPIRHTWTDYGQISVHVKKAVIAAEDANFADHDGVDWDAIEKAYDLNQRRGKPVRGGSTITMQLAKNLFLSPERSYLRKGQELVITYMLEGILDKRRILELYLNVAEWGVGVFGVEAAARHYYGLSASQLSPMQAARLASMLPRPRYYDRNRQASALSRKAGMIVRRMAASELP